LGAAGDVFESGGAWEVPVASYHFDIGSRAQKAGRFIARVRDELVRVLSEKKRDGLTQHALAQRLGVNRSVINRQLSGESNLTLRSLADIAWAMDMELSFELRHPEKAPGRNEPVTTSTINHGQIRVVNVRSPKNGAGYSHNSNFEPFSGAAE
jgi:transcriptional regulator with XRE-family HTH domain